MKKLFITACVAATMTLAVTPAFAQTKAKKKQTIEAKAMTQENDVVAKLMRPTNNADAPVPNKRGDRYGANFSDIIVDNYTGWYIDIYIDGEFRGTLSPWDKRVTWSIPGSTTLYAKATFDDGSYRYWGPTSAQTGYEYQWNLR